MAALMEKEKELVAIGTAIGAGCQPCTQHHVRAALECGLTRKEVQRAIEEAQVVRQEGGIAVANVGRRLLEIERQEPQSDCEPSDRRQVLTYLGTAAGCNAGSLLTRYVARARELGLSAEELRATLEVTEAVKKGAAMFLRRDTERALKGTAAATEPAKSASAARCCGPGAATVERSASCT
jgi:AhpD family alkylhydroperoxidase